MTKESTNLRKKRLREFYKKKELCTDCGRKAKQGVARCIRCHNGAKKWFDKNRAKLREGYKSRYQDVKAKGICPGCGKKARKDRVFCEQCRMYQQNHQKGAGREKHAAAKFRHRRKLKAEAIKAYGGECDCCGEKIFELLSIDHIEGGGCAHRREIGPDIYPYLKERNYPSGYRLLCMNCNFTIGKFGFCPHNPKVIYRVRELLQTPKAIWERNKAVRVRQQIFDHYGDCQCCGESERMFLTMDHIGGTGKEHRKSVDASNLYPWLIRHDFPKGFRSLCMSCNWVIGVYGYCPHEQEKAAA